MNNKKHPSKPVTRNKVISKYAGNYPRCFIFDHRNADDHKRYYTENIQWPVTLFGISTATPLFKTSFLQNKISGTVNSFHQVIG
jgi:hypothetical protein